MKILFVSDVFGQLGNRLFRFARLQLGRPAGVALVDLTLCDYARLYQPRHPFVRIGFRFLGVVSGNLVARFHALLPHAAQQHLPLESRKGSAPPRTTSFASLYADVVGSPRRFHYVERHSYYFDCPMPASSEKNRLRDIFRLRRRYTRAASRLLARIPEDSIIVAVHVRRGDYREYAGGKSFFSDDVYLRSIAKLQATHAGAAKLAFVLVSDEVLDEEKFRRDDMHYFGPQPIGIDQAILSQSKYILGPSSTFSAWPAFLHDIPRAEIRNQADLPEWRDFVSTDVNFRTVSFERNDNLTHALQNSEIAAPGLPV